MKTKHMYKAYLKPGKEESLKRFHPWVFSGAIARIEGQPEEGDIVEVYTAQNEFIAKGHCQIGSIAIRVLSFRQDEKIDRDFWRRKLQAAYDMRRNLHIGGNPANDTYRLVHGEGDNLPGLVVDIYGRTVVMQAHSPGMHVDRMEIADALADVMGDTIDSIYYKSESTLPYKADLYPEKRLPQREQHRQRGYRVRAEISHRLAERTKDRLLRRPTRKPGIIRKVRARAYHS